MRPAKRAKAIAAGGIASVLLGAVLLVAPPGASAHHSAGPTPTVVSGNAACPAGQLTFKFDSPFNVSSGTDTRNVDFGDGPVSVTISYTGVLIDGVRHYNWTLDQPTSGVGVATVIVKQGNDSAIFTYNPAATSGVAYVALLDSNADRAGTSHVTFCLSKRVTTTTESTTTTTTSTTTTTTTTSTTPTTQPAPTTTAVDVGGVVTTPTTAASTTEAPATTAAPTTAAEVQVMGATVTRTLPRTGSGTGHLATAGIALMIFGGILVGGSRRALLGTN